MTLEGIIIVVGLAWLFMYTLWNSVEYRLQSRHKLDIINVSGDALE